MKGYLVQLSGKYFIPNKFKSKFKNLDLEKNLCRIDENVNIIIDYMSFIIYSKNEFEIMVGDSFFNKVKNGLQCSNKQENNIYIMYKEYLQKYFNKENLEINEINVKPIGVKKYENGYLYNEKYIDCSAFNQKEKVDITYAITRILTCYELDELIKYYKYIKDRIERRSTTTHKNNMLNILEEFYKSQRNDILQHKRLSMFNSRNGRIVWKLNEKIDYVDSYESDYQDIDCTNFFWVSNDECLYEDYNNIFKYKYFINIEPDMYNCMSNNSIFFKDVESYIISVDIVISPEYLNKEILKNISKQKNIDIDDINYIDVNSNKEYRFSIYKEQIIYEGNTYDNLYNDFNIELLTKKVLENKKLNIKLDNNFLKFYIDKLNISIKDKFYNIDCFNKNLESLLNKCCVILDNIEKCKNKKANNINKHYNSICGYYENECDYTISPKVKKSYEEINKLIKTLAQDSKICYRCYSEYAIKNIDINDDHYGVCEECYEKFIKEQKYYREEETKIIEEANQEFWQSVDFSSWDE